MAKKLIVGEDSCPGCRMAKNYLKEELESGEFEFVDIESEEGQVIDKKFKIQSIPECYIRKDGGGYEHCDLEHEIEESLKRKGKK
jgi:thioredoxin-like negative regulator of GroEL